MKIFQLLVGIVCLAVFFYLTIKFFWFIIAPLFWLGLIGVLLIFFVIAMVLLLTD